MTRAAHCIGDDALWQAHTEAKAALIDEVKQQCDIELNPDHPILGFARRMTAYKRPDLLFSELACLKAIAGQYPFQMVLEGKAHPMDHEGKQFVEILHQHLCELAGTLPIAYLPDYDMALALKLVSGSDVWLNTPS